MSKINDLQTVMRLLKEYELPISPILEYTIKEKIEQLSLNNENPVVKPLEEGNNKHTNRVAETLSIERPRSGTKAKASALRVTFADGTVICERKAVDTLKKCIVKFGPERVAQLCLQPVDNILQLNRVNLVTKKRDEMYANRQHEIGNGWLVFTCSNTPAKKRQIEAIAKALNIKVRVELV